MNRRHFLAGLSALPLVGGLFAKSEPAPLLASASPPPRWRVVDEPPPGTVPTQIWWELILQDTHRIDGIAGPVSAVFPIKDGKWVELLPGAHWIADASGLLVDGAAFFEPSMRRIELFQHQKKLLEDILSWEPMLNESGITLDHARWSEMYAKCVGIPELKGLLS